jgi:8-oxo-dGTP pyrophosphatase MutT (NUDIX family)
MIIASYQEFKQYLTLCFDKKLPGIESHLMLASSERKPDILNKELHLKAKKSSVLMFFYEKNGETYLALIKRPIYAGVHSGQISFPGGKWELSDTSLFQTALRESHEEIGLHSDKVELMGELTALYIPPSNYLVTPFVGTSKGSIEFSADPKEVAEIIEIPVNYLLNGCSNFQSVDIQMSDGTILQSKAIIFKGNVIWGATAMILNEFIILWKTTVYNR